ncbi:MAG: protein kinase [Gemmataceae bacterium]
MTPGETIGPFTIDRELGSGAMGTVYKATFHKDDKDYPVAFKVVSFGLLGNEGALARFDREASILKQLKHPHIVRLVGHGRYKKAPYIVMEYVDGEALDKPLGRRGKLGWEDVVEYGKQLCDALQHAHEKGIIHRDLKPSNLMLTKDGALKLTDFGIAKDTDVTALTAANNTIGTAAYMSPEQCRGEKTIGAKSDLYSLGVVFYELLTGKKPFVADTTMEMFLKHVNDQPVRPRKLVPDLPVWLDNLVMFLLEKDKEKRPLDAATVGRMLGEITEKVSAGKSVGAEVANARRVDRPIGDAPLDAADKEAARSLRKPGKKRKKKKDDGKWGRVAQAAGLVAALVALVGFGAYMLWPEGIDAAYKRVEAAASPEAKAEAAAQFLKDYGGAPGDERVKKAFDLHRAGKVRAAEKVLANRFGSKFQNAAGDYPKELNDLAMQAMGAEKAGDLKRAADLWDTIKGQSPALDPAKATDEDEVNKAVLGWVADRRVALIRDEVPAAVAKVRKQVEDDRTFDRDWKYAPTDPEGQAARALLLEDVKDRPKARRVWDGLAKQTEADPDRRAWFLLAAQRAAGIEDKRPDEEVTAARRQLVTAAIAGLEKVWQQVKADPDKAAEQRGVRTGCRELIALYADDPDEPVTAAVERAKKLLEAATAK